jgi:hypothetical protein
LSVTERNEFRRAIADEVATLRAVNTALRGPLSLEDAAHLNAVRQASLAVLRSLLGRLYGPGEPTKRVRRVSR